MFIRMRNLLSGLIIGIALAGCGGGGGQVAEGGIGGTGISTGTVTGFGSVYVNGVKYETPVSTNFTGDDNEDGNEAHLEKGMVVTVKGTVNNDGVTGTASSIEYEDLIEGAITKGANTLTIMGHTVNVDANTVYKYTTDFSTLSDNDEVEVSGYYDDNYNIKATYVELTSSGIQEISGTVTDIPTPNVDFVVNGKLTVISSAAVNIGDYVEVKGTYSRGSGELTPTEPVEIKQEGFDIDNENIAELEGVAVTSCGVAAPCTFILNGVTVKVNLNTEFDSGSPADITPGRLLEVEGSLISGELVATEVEFEDGAEVMAEVASVVVNVGTKTLSLVDSNGVLSVLEVIVNSDPGITEFDASSYAGITAGDQLSFEGMINGSGQLVASRVESGSSSEVELEATIDSYLANTSITVMGVTIVTSGMIFTLDDGSISGQPLTESQFYDRLVNNKANIEVKGTLSGGAVTWTEIELDL